MYQIKAKLVAVPTTLKHISSDNVQPSSQTNAAEKIMFKKEKSSQKSPLRTGKIRTIIAKSIFETPLTGPH